MVIGLILAGVGVVLVGVYAMATYNRFINLRNGIESSFNQINVALKKRLDLIGEVVDSTKGIMKFEKGTLTEITKLRGQAAGNLTPELAAKLSNATGRIAGAISVQVEAYPKLSSNENVKQLVDSLQEVEQQIAQLRYTYNNTVQEFNTSREMFPSSIIAGMFGFSKNSYLQMKEPQESLEKRPDTSI
ncbi:LemA family protein [Candidatus Woesearchaeota archaeon]|nr:LemA family protein [Candidatus Woesearchaeota archaeon]